ncbi:hypothetical protein J5X84_24190 [Streptosporangiaceae bacterium NEAU-GS5]|nr:hypothetical protein [Streptosporangiaceae bacterium NEAU-GS5]
MPIGAVEIKVNVVGGDLEKASHEFGLAPGAGRRGSVYFCEDVSEVLSPSTPLLDSGVLLRARDFPGDDSDSTVKLRPCRMSQLAGDWLGAAHGNGWKYKVEADWSGPRKVLAASCTAERPDGRIAAVRSGAKPIESLFGPDQERFLLDCAAIRVNLRALTLLPPIAATRWEPFDVEGLSVVAERWAVGDRLDFLELSIRVPAAEAAGAQRAFERLVRDHGIGMEPAQETKTRRVIEYLVTSAGGG